MKLEKYIQERIHSKLGGLREVKTPSGNIDLLLNNHIYEIKEVIKWKEGIGQLKSYTKHFPQEMHLFLVLFGKEKDFNRLLPNIKNICGLEKINLLVIRINFELVQSGSIENKISF